MKNIVRGIAGLAIGLSVAVTASAAPPAKKAPAKAAAPAKWIKVPTLVFEHHLPSNWTMLEKKRRDFSEPTTGSWRYASPNGYTKVFVRISTIKDGGIQGAFTRALASLKKRVEGLKEIKRHVLPTGADKHPHGIVFWQGVTAVRDPKSKQVKGLAHIIARYFRQVPEFNRQVAVTYLFGAGREAQLEKFMIRHAESFELYDPVVVTKKIIEMAKKDPTPVLKPKAPTAKQMAAALKALGKDGHKVIEAPSKAAAKH